jgi:hypothetical protein
MESTYQATDLTTPNLTDENLVWTVRFERQTRQNFPDSALAAQIASKPTWKALQVIAATIKTDNTPEINLTPSWWPWMPMIPGRISIVSEVVLP